MTISLIIDLNNQGRVDYGSAYANNTEHYSSLVYYGDKLYIDCWGLIKTGAKIVLEREVFTKLKLDGPVNSIYTDLKSKGEVVRTLERDRVVYPDLTTGVSIFIDNRKESTDQSGKRRFVGYDHVMTYIEDFDYVDSSGQTRHLDHALVGIGEEGKGLQIYDFDEKYVEWTKTGIKFCWGDQLKVSKDD